MNLQPHQRQFAHTYTGPAYSQPPQQQQQQQNFAGPNAPEPCYNCGSSQHVAQHCREPRRAVPAGSLNPASRSQRGGSKKNNSKPIVTRFAPPPNYTNNPYPQQPLFPQIGPSRPHQQSVRQQPQKQWQQSPQGYGPPVQAWQQPYVAPAAAPSQATTYGPRQPQAPQHIYGKPAQSPYPQQQHPYNYTPKQSWATSTQPPTHQRPPQSHYSTAPQVHHQASYIQTQNHQQYQQQQQPIQSPYTPMAPQGFPHIPTAQNYHQTHRPQPQPQQFTQQSAAPTNAPTPQQQAPPPKPPPCFPSPEKIANPPTKSGVIIWRPAQSIEIPLAATFAETDEQRSLKQSTELHTGLPRCNSKKKHFSKYCDAKGNRIGKDLTAYEAGSEMMRDPAFTSVRTGESMVAQPLDFVLPDDPEEEELEEVAVGESANEQGLENGMKAETEDPMRDPDGSSEGTEAGDEQSDTQKGPGKRKAKMHSSAGISDRKNAEGGLSETKRSWNRQQNASTQGYSNGARGPNNGGNQGKRKSRSPPDNSRPQKHRVREAPVSIPTSSIQPHHHGLPTQPLSLPPHHPLPPKPVVAPPPPQNFHHSNNRPQNGSLNRPQGVGNRRNQGYKQRTHPYGRRSASPVRHMLVDNQRRDYGQKGKGKGQHGQQQVPGGQ